MIRSEPKGGKHRPGNGAAPKGNGKDTAPQQKRTNGQQGFFRRNWWMFAAVPVILLLMFIFTFWYAYARTNLPNPPKGAQTTFVYDRHGRLVAQLHSTINRTVVPLSRISPNLQHAVIAIEDKDFYKHGGVSFFSIFRAAWADVTHRRIEQGGSTITQQYVKNVYTGGERSLKRKIKEAMLAVKVDHKYSKNEILEKYLNTIYFGNGAYGAEAAARTYFGVSAGKLDPLQAATLAAVISAPARFDPVNHPDANKVRRDVVLDRMAEQGYITRDEADQFKSQPVKVKERAETTQSSKFAYFVSMVTKDLGEKYGYAETFSGGLRVTTTLDSAFQRAAERAVAQHLPDPKDPAAALVAIDPATGEIRALVGGRDFNKVKFNNATQAKRQAGSSFKTFTLTAAMEQRINPKAVMNGPPEVDITDPRCKNPDGTDWKPHNYADESGGTMNLIQATAHSVNTIFAQLVVTVGPDHVADVAQRMGIRTPLQPVCSITLGTQDVTPLDMADAYATLAARGVHHPPMAITTVKAADGTVIDKVKSEEDVALAENDADLVTYALQQVVLSGTGTAARLSDRPVAGKTGTTQDYRDAWFCGYVPQLTTCVWMGYQKSQKPMHNVEGVPNVFGGSIPAQIWNDFMTQALAKIPPKDFPTPSFAGYNKSPKGAVPSPSPSPSPSTSPSPSPNPTISIPSPPSPPPTSPPSPPPSPSPSESPGESPSPPAGQALSESDFPRSRRWV
jgi:1A family penicillin-binding protein